MKRILRALLLLCALVLPCAAQTFSYNGTEPSAASITPAATTGVVNLNQTIPSGHVLGIVVGTGASNGANNAAGINYTATGCQPLNLANGDQFISTGYLDACYIYPTNTITSTFTVTFTTSTVADIQLWDFGVTGLGSATLVADARQSNINESASSPFNGITETLSGANNYAIIQAALTNGHAITAVSSPYTTNKLLNAAQTGLSSAASINTNSGTAPSWTAASTGKTVTLAISFGVPTTPCDASFLVDMSGGTNGNAVAAGTMLSSTFGLSATGNGSNNSVWSFPAGTTQLSFSNTHYVDLLHSLRFCSSGATESNGNHLSFQFTTDGTAGQYVAEMTLPQMPGFPGLSIGKFSSAGDWIVTDTPNNDNGGWTDALNLYGISGNSFSNASFEPNGSAPIWKLEGSGSTIGNIPATSSGVAQYVSIQYDANAGGRSKLAVFAKTLGGNLYQLGNTVDKPTTGFNLVEWLILGRNGGNGSPTTGLHFWHSNTKACTASADNGVCPFPLLFDIPVTSQLASTLLDSSRSIDWTLAGDTGMSNGSATLPSSGWSKSGATIAAYGTSGSPLSCATIATAFNGASANSFILLGTGDFWLSAGCSFTNNSVALRFSAGTTLHFADGTTCGSFDTAICFHGSSTNEGSAIVLPSPTACSTATQQCANWTAGYAQGATSITLDWVGAGGTILAAGQLLVLDQANDTVAENGFFPCDVTAVCNTNSPNPSSAGRLIAGVDWSQQQIVKVVSITGAGPFTVTITPGLDATNWGTNGKSPGAWWTVTQVQNVGIENIASGVATIDYSASSSSLKSGVTFQNAYNYWVSGIRSIGNETIRNHVWQNLSAHGTVLSNYFYGTGPGSSTYCLENYETSDALEVNNIMQHCANDVINGAAQGLAYGYNYATDFYSSPAGVMGGSYFFHDAGGDHNLAEGNRTVQYTLDNVHGTGGLAVLLRNQIVGWEFGKTSLTNPFNANAYQREFSIIGNVLGTSTYHTVYWDDESAATGNPYKAILLTGFSGAGESTSGSIPNDSQVMTSAMYWGNYDTVNAASRFNCYETGTNGCPPSQVLPTSLMFTSKPAWYVDGIGSSSIPWPLNGPDVSGGSDPTGHANLSPAGKCATLTTVDATRQVTYTITAASYNGGTQIETLTIGSNAFLQGDEIAIAGASPGGVNGPQLVTGSTGTTVSYGAAVNPNWASGGTITWPNILSFNPVGCYVASAGTPQPFLTTGGLSYTGGIQIK